MARAGRRAGRDLSPVNQTRAADVPDRGTEGAGRPPTGAGRPPEGAGRGAGCIDRNANLETFTFVGMFYALRAN